jgi:N-acetylmuramoyl-L-alanine amidase
LRDSPEKYRLVVGGVEIEMTIGMSFARTGGKTELLAAAPAMSEGKLYVPFSLVSDLLPRIASGFRYDAPSGELLRFSGSPSRAATTPAEPKRAESVAGADAQRQPPKTPKPAQPPRRRIVVVDAGHGGPDRGMSGPIGSRQKMYEADVTLAVARRVRDALVARGVDVVMTRSTDTLIALDDRGRIANRAQGDVFISIHVNAANPRWRNPGGARGYETYFLAEAKTDDERRVEEMENEAVKYEVETGAKTGDDLSFIINDMKQNEYLRESSELAEIVQRTLGTVHPGASRGVKQAGFRVLISAYMPAILVEIGFGTNPAEAAYIRSASGQRDLAESIATATIAYLSRYGRRASSSPTLQ